MRRVLDKFVVGVEDNKANLTVAEDTQLHRLLHQSESSLLKGDLSVALVGDSFDLDLLSSHGCVKCVCV